jgi:hypothetical protein
MGFDVPTLQLKKDWYRGPSSVVLLLDAVYFDAIDNPNDARIQDLCVLNLGVHAAPIGINNGIRELLQAPNASFGIRSPEKCVRHRLRQFSWARVPSIENQGQK